MQRSFLCLLLIALCAAGCGGTQLGDASGRLHVVTTTSMLADLASEIGGEHVDVTGLMGPGVDPHLYKASAGDVSRMSGADVILYNGFHLEGKMTDVFGQMTSRGIPTFAAAEESTPEEALIESDQFSGNYDPHVWFDISLWQGVAHRTAEILIEMDSTHADEYRRQLDRYLLELEEVDAYVRRRTDEIPADMRVIVTSHDAFGYFGRAYGYDVRGLQGISTAAEAGTADVQELADFVAARRIPALFVETSVSPRGIEAVREAVRARGFQVGIGGTLYGDALGDPGSPAGSYLGMMRENIDTIVASLTDEPA
jgi:manganese/zinc/iron transport system substrate-binding protein